MADDRGSDQREIDFPRAEQLGYLRDCELPKDAKDQAGKGVSATVLKAVLNAIDQYGRGRDGRARPAVPTLARAANVGPRTAARALEVLVSLGLVCVTNDGPRWGYYGAPTNRYTIVWSELALLVNRGPLARAAALSQTSADHRATDPLFDTDHRATSADHRATGGALNDQETTMKRRLKRPDETGRDGARNLIASDLKDEGSDCESDPAFSEEELAGVRFKANTIDKWIAASEPGDRQLVLKVATLWHDGELPDDCVEQVLESFQRKHAAREPIASPCGWLWTTLRGQLRKHGVRLEQLLARTRWPAELLTVPRERSTAPT